MDNSRRSEWSLALLLLVFVFLSAYAIQKYTSSPIEDINPIASSTVAVVQPPSAVAAGNVTLSLGESARFDKVTIKPLSIVEESRCPKTANCIQAGTIKILIEVVSSTSATTTTIGLNQPVLTDTSKITLLSADPYPEAGKTIKPSAYRLTFNVARRPILIPNAPTPVPPVAAAPCFVGGCSGQTCSDQEGMVSTCEFRAEYACYKTARCERQTNGQCGWTQTNALKVCLANPPPLE